MLFFLAYLVEAYSPGSYMYVVGIILLCSTRFAWTERSTSSHDGNTFAQRIQLKTLMVEIQKEEKQIETNSGCEHTPTLVPDQTSLHWAWTTDARWSK